MHQASVLPSRKKLLLAAIACIAASFVCFGQSINDNFLMFDDPYVVVNNLKAHGPTLANVKAAFSTYDPELYIPVTLISYQINYLFAGLHPALYHITNLVLHGLNAFLLGIIILLMIRREKLALFFALLYAVHPLNTEAAVWIAARKDTLSTFFLFASIALYLRYSETIIKKYFFWSIGLYVLAALSKGSVLTLPLLLPVLDFLRDQGRWSAKKSTKAMLPFIGIAILTALIALGGKQRVIESSSMLETALMAAKSTMFYLQKIVVPTNLTAIYPYTKDIVFSSPDFYQPVIMLVLICAAALYAVRYTYWGLATLFLFLVSLGPSFFNFHKGTTTFFAVDRYAYVALAWLMLLFAKTTSEILTKNPSIKKPIATAGILILILPGFLSVRQTGFWRNDETVFGRALDLYPQSVTARVSLSVWYRESGRRDDERKILEEGLAFSRDTALLLGLGSIDVREGNIDTAVQLFNEAMTNDPKNPEPHFYRGSLEEALGQTDDAVAAYRKAIQLDSSYVAAYTNLGAILLDRRELPEAEELLRTAIKWNPNALEAHMNLFQILELTKRTDEAFLHLETSYKLDQNNSRILLDYGYRLSTRDRKNEAIHVLEKLMMIDPRNHTGDRLLRSLKPEWKPVTSKEVREAPENTAPL